jgi:hypothetical protein
MNLLDPFLFLLGNRGAIERIAACRWALPAGFLFVLSAGLARNYDHLWLLGQPEWFLGPLAMSLFSAGFIFAILGAVVGFGGGFLSWLALFWLTAPCAWIYGIPVESHTDLLTATKWNLGFLGIVSVWRVVLMTRATVVLTGEPTWAIFCAILAPCCWEMFFGSINQSFSLVGIMGGVRLPPHHLWLKSANETVQVVSLYLGLLSIGALIVAWFLRRRRKDGFRPRGFQRLPLLGSRSWWVFPTLAIVAWCLMAWPSQRLLENNYKLQQLLNRGDYRQALDFAATRKREDFTAMHLLPPVAYLDPRGFPEEEVSKRYPRLAKWLAEGKQEAEQATRPATVDPP